MPGRYTGWARVLLRGDTNLAQRYVVEGRKYLEELKGRLQGSNTGAVRRMNADGILFTASFHGGQPTLVIEAPQGGGSKDAEPLALDGFIVRPSPTTSQASNLAKNHVLLRRPKSGGWRAHFYNEAAVPVGYALKYGVYGELAGDPPLFGDGIGRYGNIDWRNTPETVMVTWHGPEGRYFNDTAATFRPSVYFKGSRLLDLTAVEAGFGLAGGVVLGACLRSEESLGPCLYVIARYNSDGYERLMRFPVKPTAAAKAACAGLPNVRWFEYPALEVNADEEAAVLSAWTPTAGGDSCDHPWFFNQSGTQARRIVINAGSYEESLTLVGDVWTYGVALHAWVAGTRTTEATTTAAATPVMYDGAPETPMTLDLVETAGGDTVLTRHEVVTEAFSDPWRVYAVDFRNDVAVYGYLHPRYVSSSVRDFTRTMALAGTVNTTSGPGGYFEKTITVQGSQTITASYTTNTVAGGLKTDWMEYVAPAKTSTYTHTESLSEDTTQTLIDEGTGSDPGYETHTGSGPLDFSVEYDAVTATPAFVVGYLDLRYHLALYGVHTVQEARSDSVVTNYETGDYPQPGAMVDPWQVGNSFAPLMPAGTYNRAVDLLLDAEMTVNGQVAWSISNHQLAATANTAPSHPAYILSIFTGGSEGARTRPLALAMHSTTGQYLLPAEFTVWVDATTPPGDTSSYEIETMEGEAYAPTIDQAALMMREAAIDGTTAAMTNDYRDTTSNFRFGAWQAYKGKFCFSMTLSAASGPVSHYYGLGDLSTGVAEDETLPGLTGSAQPRFHPVGVLTPTRIQS